MLDADRIKPWRIDVIGITEQQLVVQTAGNNTHTALRWARVGLIGSASVLDLFVSLLRLLFLIIFLVTVAGEQQYGQETFCSDNSWTYMDGSRPESALKQTVLIQDSQNFGPDLS